MEPGPRKLVTISEDHCAEMNPVLRLSKAAKSDRDEYLVWLWELCRPEIVHADQWAAPLLPRIRYNVYTDSAGLDFGGSPIDGPKIKVV
jgi:hypothetical protein